MDKVVVADYDYEGDDDSFLSFKTGDHISVLHEDDDSGWYRGKLLKNGQRGLFPITYVSVLPAVADIDTSHHPPHDTHAYGYEQKAEQVPTHEEHEYDDDDEEYEYYDEEYYEYDAAAGAHAGHSKPRSHRMPPPLPFSLGKASKHAYQPSQESVSTMTYSSHRHLALSNKDSSENAAGEAGAGADHPREVKLSVAKSGPAYASNPDRRRRRSALFENYYSSAPLNLKTNPNSRTRYGLASHYMSMFASISTVCCGISCYFWHIGSHYIHQEFPKFERVPELHVLGFDFDVYLWMTLYSVVFGLALLAWEYGYGFARSSRCCASWCRILGYLGVGVPLFLTLPTAFNGLLWLVVSWFSYLGWKNREVYEWMAKKSAHQQSDNVNCCKRVLFCHCCASLRRQSQIKKYAFVVAYLCFNVLYTAYWMYYYWGVVTATNALARSGEDATLAALAEQNGAGHAALTYWFPVAKGFGNLLDVNCAFILLPVCRTFLTKLYNISTDQRTLAKYCNFVLSFVPLDKAPQFHKLCAFLIAVGTVFHSLAHLNQIAFVPYSYDQIYGLTVWVSGFLIILLMLFIYCTSFVTIRSGKFEFFWYTHHLSIAFFVLLLLHGKNSINPNFWKWFVLPGLIYACERVIRAYNARQKVGVISVLHMNNKTANVFCLELEKVGVIQQHKEGQYIFIKAPFISNYQWHPFTISSPPDSKTLTLHIRNMGPGTWTDRLQTFFAAMAPKNTSYTELYHRGGNILQPQSVGPDGRNLICIDGPIAAPTQHLGEYSVSLIVGAGIGVTPVRSTLLSIVFYRLKKGIGRTYPDHCTAVWVVNYSQLEAYRFMCRTLKEIEDELCNVGDLAALQKSLLIHIYVTSVPTPLPPWNEDQVSNLGNDKQRDLSLWGQHYDYVLNESHTAIKQKRMTAPFNEIDIWKYLKQPTEHVMQLGHIVIHKGRPKFGNDIFYPMQQQYAGNKVGVMYCGPHVIANQLKEECGRYTDFSSNTQFILHKENF